MGQSPTRKYPYPNPNGDGADVSYWAQRLANAVDTDMVATLSKITAAVATGTSNAAKIAANLSQINGLKTRATNLESRNGTITDHTNKIAANLAKILALTTRVGRLETNGPFIMHAGVTIITLPVGFAGNSIPVNFPGPDFTVPPVVTLGAGWPSTGDSSKVITRHYDVTKDGFRIDIGTSDNRPSNSTYSFKVHWQAVQMKTGSANG